MVGVLMSHCDGFVRQENKDKAARVQGLYGCK